MRIDPGDERSEDRFCKSGATIALLKVSLNIMMLVTVISLKVSEGKYVYTNQESRNMEGQKPTSGPTRIFLISPAHVPPLTEKLGEDHRKSNVTNSSSVQMEAAIALMDQDENDRDHEDAPRNQVLKVEGIEELEDDDYNVVILDDDIPWDLTEDTAGINDEETAKPEKGLSVSPTTEDPIASTNDYNNDYLVIVLEDDVPWDDLAEAEYFKDALEAINNANSNSSIDTDSDYRIVYPTPLPPFTASPSGSTKPTPLESTHSTGIPSKPPSDYPSFLPTISPSQIPSTSPTYSCHDIEAYRSPINGLTCSQHRDTNCLNWRHVGLNMTELQTLVVSCPITCQIECGSFQLFSAPVSFRISRVLGFMEPEDVDSLLEFAIYYLKEFVRNYIGRNTSVDEREKSNYISSESEIEILDESSVGEDNNAESFYQYNENNGIFWDGSMADKDSIMVEIQAAVLKAQNLIDGNPFPAASLEKFEEERNEESKNNFVRNKRLLRLRGLQDLQRTKQQSSGRESIVNIDKALDVIIIFKGFTIGMDPKKVSELLVLGVDSVDFTRELQQSRIHFFSDATVSSAIETPEENFFLEVDLEDDEIESNSTFSVIISYMVPIVVIGFALGSLFYHKCYVNGHWVPPYNSHGQNKNTIERVQICGITVTPTIAPKIKNDEGDREGDSNFPCKVSSSFGSVETNDLKIKTVNNRKVGKRRQSKLKILLRAFQFSLPVANSKNSLDEEEEVEAEEALAITNIRSTSCARKGIVQQGMELISCDAIISPISGDATNGEDYLFDNEVLKDHASLLPPMIVIDNIDAPMSDAKYPVMMATNSTFGNRNGLLRSPMCSSSAPLEELDIVASEFRKQLIQRSTTAFNSPNRSLTGSCNSIYSSSTLDLGVVMSEDPTFLSHVNHDDEDDIRLIKGIVSDEWDADELFSHIPSNITTKEDGIENEELLPQAEDISLTSLPLNASIQKVERRNFGTRVAAPVAAVTNLDSYSVPASRLVQLLRGTKSELHAPKFRSALQPKHSLTPERISGVLHKSVNGSNAKHPSVSERQQRRSSFPKFTPLTRALVNIDSNHKIEAKGHIRKISFDTAPDLCPTKIKSSISTLPNGNDLIIGGSKSDGPNCITCNERLEFEAPRDGNWGLVLESSSISGPKVYTVKDYSPLFGLIQKGDRLLEIDGKNVSQSSLADVTKFIKGKSSSYSYNCITSATIPIVVSRHPFCNIDSPAQASSHYHIRSSNGVDYNHQRNSSYDSFRSAGSLGSRVIKNVDDDIE